MITVRGEEWGTAAELASRLGGDVTEAMIRRWRERDGLTTHRAGRLYSPLRETAALEAAKRRSGRGRPRRVDFTPVPG